MAFPALFSALFSLLLWAIQPYGKNGLLPCATDKTTQFGNTHISEKVPLRALCRNQTSATLY